MTPEEEAEAALQWRFSQREQKLKEEQKDREAQIEKAALAAYHNQPPALQQAGELQRPYEYFLSEERRKMGEREERRQDQLRTEYEQERDNLKKLVAANGLVQRGGSELAAKAIKPRDEQEVHAVPFRDPTREFNQQGQRDGDVERMVIEEYAKPLEQARQAKEEERRLAAEREPEPQQVDEFNLQAARQRTPEQEVIYRNALAEIARRREEEREREEREKGLRKR